MHLYLIRHGESYHNIQPLPTLETVDTSLTEKGQKQVAALHDWIKNNPIPMHADVLYYSTMRRTKETAFILAEAFNFAPVPDDRIREINSSYSTGHAIEEAKLPRTYNPDLDSFAPRTLEFNNAESWMHFRTRLGQFVNMLLEKHLDQTVYLVIHGGVINGILDNCFNVAPVRNISIAMQNTSWTHLEYRPDNDDFAHWFLRAHNRIDHLIGKDLL